MGAGAWGHQGLATRGVPVHDAYIHLMNLSNQHVMDVDHSKAENDTAILVYPKHTPAAPNQQWRLEPAGNNRFYITSALNPHMVIEIPSKNGNKPGAKVHLCEKNQGLNQQWEWSGNTIHSALSHDLVLAYHSDLLSSHGSLVVETRNGKPTQSWQEER